MPCGCWPTSGKLNSRRSQGWNESQDSRSKNCFGGSIGSLPGSLTSIAMKRLSKLATLAVIFLVPYTAIAAAGDWYVAPSITYTDDDGDRKIDDSLGGLQLQVGREMGQRFSLEGLLGYHDIDGFPGQKHLEVGVNAVGKFMPDSLFSPYVIGGLGFLRADVGEPDFGGLPPAGTTESSATATAGLGLQVKFGDSPWSLRAEWRLRRTLDSDDTLTDQVGSIGVQYSFGGGAERSAPASIVPAEPAREAETPRDAESVPDVIPDTDGDGILDDRDECPGTKAGADVDATGCEKIRLENVYFDTESSRLSAAAQRKLDVAAEILARHADVKVDIAGHADSRGPEDYNMGLSERRAAAVRDYLQQKGIDPARMTVRGYGESQPAASNDTPQGQAENRRVELHAMGR